MNILIDELPQEVNGKRINSDFRRMVLFELMMQDPEVPKNLRIPFAIDYLYAEPVDTLDSAINGLLWFYQCGKTADDDTKSINGDSAGRAYDFEQDASFIYADFLAVYGIDLNEIEYLHWWKFRAMFISLPESAKMTQVMRYRLADLSDLKGKEKAFYKRMKALYKINSALPIAQLSLAAQEEKLIQRVNDRFAAAEAWAKQKEAEKH